MNSEETERAVAGALVSEPGRLTDLAYAWLSERDFADERARFVVALVMETWHQAQGDVTPGPRWQALITAALVRRFGVSADEAGGWLSDTLDLAPAACHRRLFEFHAQQLAGWRAMRETARLFRQVAARIEPGQSEGPREWVESRKALLKAALRDLERVVTVEPKKTEERIGVGDWR